ncbi:mercury methylation ferredoxin HgcB [Desulfurivibrio sp. D14AmB]|uniref:mercury methylation ferredoxin HgcB n=1 Tax=Desulfurivibrio sp. D14AmB TaxID=3374370 RepID=UPI00376F1BF7
MSEFRYLAGVNTLEFLPERCIGCGTCLEVCPHAVFSPSPTRGGKVTLRDRDACMECGACRHNCPTGAIQVEIGVGCAQAILGAAQGKGAESCC